MSDANEGARYGAHGNDASSPDKKGPVIFITNQSRQGKTLSAFVAARRLQSDAMFLSVPVDFKKYMAAKEQAMAKRDPPSVRRIPASTPAGTVRQATRAELDARLAAAFPRRLVA